MQNFLEESPQVTQAFKKHGQQANDYCKLFKWVHISNIQWF
ncbi:MAG: hypothetical protein JWR23_2152 [Mucilaginibacter sp.]|nr:hypothetical protein [Mucilaginibacter sp.]